MAAARLTRLTYWYPGQERPALDHVDLELGDGLTLVVGPSGGGKSTLLRVLNGLVPHFHGGRIKGSAEVRGMDVVTTPTRRLARDVGFVFQDPELQTVYDTVRREVAFGLENLGVPPAKMAGLVDDALHAAGVAELAVRRIKTLSGGERQRVAIASALVMRPCLLVLDEPTSQLDPEGAALVVDAVGMVVDQGRTVVTSEHRFENLLGRADALVDVAGGRAQTAGRDAYRRPPRSPRASRAGTPGPVAWSVSNAAAGFGGEAVLEGVDLCGRAGEVVLLTGPNGGGKSTLLRLIAGAMAPIAGRVERAPGRVAYLPQNPVALLHRPSVRSEVELTLARSGEPESPAGILEALGLSAVADRYPRDLSCGERQRAAIAAVLAGRPDLVLLDEPTRGMDATARDALIKLVARLRDAGSAVVLATHDSDLEHALADRTVHVGGGRAVERSPRLATA